MRAKIIRIGIACIFLILFLGLVNLQAVKGKKFRQLSDKNRIQLLPQAGSRGRILDANGEVIVESVLSYDLTVMPQENPDNLDKILSPISRILGRDLEGLKKAYRSNFISYSLPVTVAENIEIKKAIALEELNSGFADVIIQARPIRDYPYGKLACHVIGYLHEIDRWRLTKLADYGYKTKDIVGFGGVEENYDYFLRQEEGALSMEIDHRGRFVRMLGFRPPVNGKDIQLTLDLKVQRIVEEVMGDRRGAVIVMEPFTGEIIAMASNPSFNPSVFIKKSENAIRELIKSQSAPLLNRAISGVYPPASVFKLVVAVAALENEKINLSTTFVCPGSIFIGKRQFACWSTHGPQNLIAGIAHSCNVFFCRTGLLTGAQLIHDYALQFGFGKRPITDLPYAQAGLVPDPGWKRIYRLQGWFDGDTANFSIGQGDLLVTPIQMTRMIAVFANNGTLVAPYIVKSIDAKDMRLRQRKAVRLNIKENTINYIREGMRGVVRDERGTARILANLSVSVVGKTGTAQVPRGDSHAWFLGFFPFKNPKFTICVFLEHGGHGYTSALLAKEMIELMIKEGLVDEKI